jgi:hypothetical protein
MEFSEVHLTRGYFNSAIFFLLAPLRRCRSSR